MLNKVARRHARERMQAIPSDLAQTVDHVAVGLEADLFVPAGRPAKTSKRWKARRPIVSRWGPTWTGADRPPHVAPEDGAAAASAAGPPAGPPADPGGAATVDGAGAAEQQPSPVLQSWSRRLPPSDYFARPARTTSTLFAAEWGQWRRQRTTFRAARGRLRRGGLPPAPCAPAPAPAPSPARPGGGLGARHGAGGKLAVAPTYPSTRALCRAAPHRLRKIIRWRPPAWRPNRTPVFMAPSVRSARLRLLRQHEAALSSANSFAGLSVVRAPTVAALREWAATSDGGRFAASRSAFVQRLGIHLCSVRTGEA